MIRLIKSISAVLIITFIITALYIPCNAADEKDGKKMIIISNMGEHDSFAENSQTAIEAAIKKNADMIKIPVKRTADGIFILSADNTLSRMCGTDDTPIEKLKYDDIKNLKLSAATGGRKDKTDDTVASLREILSLYSGRTDFLIDCEPNDLEAAYTTAKDENCADKCIFVCRMSAKDAIQRRDSIDPSMKIMVYVKTNVIFTALHAAKLIGSNENAYLWLATSNQHGMIFNTAVTKKLAELNGVAICMTDRNLSGKRDDTLPYWEDLVSRNYNMFITDNISGLNEYKTESEAARTKLIEYLGTTAKQWELPTFNNKIFKEYKFEYTNALKKAETLCGKSFAGKSECENAYYNLKKSMEAIDVNYQSLSQGATEKTFTPGRIVTAVIAVPVFICIEIFFHKHRNKCK